MAKSIAQDLQVGPLRLPLIRGPEGPMVEPRDRWLKAVSWALSQLGQPDREALRASVRAGEAIYEGPIEIRPLEEGDDLEAGRAAWKERTGAELEEPLTVAAVASSVAILPRDLLVEVAEQLADLRRVEAVAPPWLFRPDPQGERAHATESALLLALERGGSAAQSESALTQVGLTTLEAWEPKLRALLAWGATDLAAAYLERVRAHDPGNPPAPPWLFTIAPRWDLVHPSERALVVELDREAEAIEVIERSLDGAEEPPELIEHRARYLRRLQDAGLLTAVQREAKLRALSAWGAVSLAGLYRAALRGLDYLTSAERAKYNPEAKETDLLSAPVCLDIFRGLKTPENATPFEWISWGEHLLRAHGPGRDVTKAQGDFPYHDQDGLVMILWRKDAGIPALRYIALEPAVIDTSLIREWLA